MSKITIKVEPTPYGSREDLVTVKKDGEELHSYQCPEGFIEKELLKLLEALKEKHQNL